MSVRKTRVPTPPGTLKRLGGLAVFVIAVDQFTKWLIMRAYEVGDSVAVLGSVMSLTRRANTGGAFGCLPGSTSLLTVVNAAVIVILLVMGGRLATRSPVSSCGLALVLGGAIGNWLDRVRLGHVVDFIDFHFWPVFNIADIGITVGAVLLVAAVVLEGRAGEGREGPHTAEHRHQ